MYVCICRNRSRKTKTWSSLYHSFMGFYQVLTFSGSPTTTENIHLQLDLFATPPKKT